MEGHRLDESYKAYLTAARVVYVTAKKSKAGNMVARNDLERAIEALDRAHLALREKVSKCSGGNAQKDR